jgi:cysteinyl-tRNA synthetase
MRPVFVYNTLTRKRELFKPIHDGFVGIYVCGPTVYGHAHLGHAKSYVAFDVIVRYLRYLGYRVRHVMNITDVGHLTDDADAGEDKLQKQARVERLEPMEIAEKYTNSFFRDMDALGVLRPDITPRASGHIPEQIALTEALIRKGHAYVAGGNVYFDVTSDPDYGKLSGRTQEEQVSGTRVEAASDKRNPADFALWKAADASHLMQWPSPWGPGYPGWHVECSAMSTKYLGQPFDIHGGGLENQFPHHECEIAQSECGHGKTFVNYWLHNNMVTLNGQKMGKSLGNAISLHEFFSGSHKLLTRAWSPQVIRFFLLQSHYRSTTDFSETALAGAEAGLKTLHRLLNTVMQSKPGNGDAYDLEALKNTVEAELSEDFNTAKAIAILYEKLRDLQQSTAKNLADVQSYLKSIIDGVLGIWPAEQASNGNSRMLVDAVMQVIISLRKEARDKKDWPTSDFIRKQLTAAGIQLKDGPEGTTYSLPD